ncbi:MAG: glycosyltransferase family 4 protein [Gemmatimonadales bacterium]
MSVVVAHRAPPTFDPAAATWGPRPLRVLLLHNFYRESGGEDEVFRAERKLLEDHGHEVITYAVHNDTILDMGKLRLLRTTFWNQAAYHRIRALIRDCQPHVLHAHNTFPLLSPSVYAAARAERVAVVQTLHNYRLICANGMLLREGAPCERCVGRAVPWPAVVGRCYRGSAAASAVAAGMVWSHRLRKTWSRQVDLYVALTSFARERFIAGGLPADRIVVKPNFVFDAWADQPLESAGDHALFVGRLAPEKGIATMLAAWRASPELPGLRIIGDGPLRDEVAAAAAADRRISWLGQLPADHVRQAMRQAGVLLVPSLCYEGAPLVIVESFAAGLPIIGSAHGAPGAQIEPAVTGLLHRPGDPADLARQVNAWHGNPAAGATMRVRARARYLEAYSAAANYRMLVAVYTRARSVAAAALRSRVPVSA